MADDPRHESIPVRRMLAILRRRGWILILCLVVGTAAAYFASHREKKKYSATAAVLFQQDELSQQLFGFGAAEYEDPTTASATNITLASQPIIAANTALALGHGITRNAVSQEVSIAAAGASSVVNVTATTTNPRFSATLANAYVTQLVNYLADSDRAQIVQAASQLQRQVNNLRATYPNDAALPSLETRLSQLDVLSATQTGDVQVANQALIPTSPSSPHVRRSTALGLVAGLLVGLIAMFLAERLDRTLRDPDDAKELFGLPLLGMIPLSRSLSSKSAAKPLAPTVAAEAFRLLLAQLRYFNVDREMRSVLVTSAAPGDGKSTVAWNLARTAAALNPHSSVLLVDADLRRSSIASMAYIDPAPGLAEALTRDLPLEKVINSFDVDGPQDGRQARLHVLTAGAPAPNPSELLESQRLRHLVDRLQSLYDLVIFDTPPTALVSDAIPLMTRVSGVIVVVRLRNTRRDNAKRLHDQLVSLGAPALGIVVNGVPAALSSYGGYPGYAAYAPATTVAQAAP